MSEPIEEAYFNWLCSKVLDPSNNNYRVLLNIFHTTEFTWIIPADEHRAKDGQELRTYFLNETGFPYEHDWFVMGCSVLEMLIAFSDRAAFQLDTSLASCFWEFVQNLGLDEYRHVDKRDVSTIEAVLHNFVWRTYDEKGVGGAFPLRHFNGQDQRTVEIWYQFYQYLEDQGRM